MALAFTGPWRRRRPSICRRRPPAARDHCRAEAEAAWLLTAYRTRSTRGPPRPHPKRSSSRRGRARPPTSPAPPSSWASGAPTQEEPRRAAGPADPARGTVATGGTGDGATRTRSQARSVSLDQEARNCPWPADADAQQVNEQTVVLRAAVGVDGHVEHVDVLSDPGFEFAPPRACAHCGRASSRRALRRRADRRRVTSDTRALLPLTIPMHASTNSHRRPRDGDPDRPGLWTARGHGGGLPSDARSAPVDVELAESSFRDPVLRAARATASVAASRPISSAAEAPWCRATWISAWPLRARPGRSCTAASSRGSPGRRPANQTPGL